MSAAPTLFPTFVPRTAKQLRALHAAARRLHLSHDDLRAMAGVQSLNQLSCDAAARLLDRLNQDRPTAAGPVSDRSPVGPVSDRSPVGPVSDRSPVGPVSDRSPVGPVFNRSARKRPRWRPGVIKPASCAQRNLIRRLFTDLAWPLEQCRGWIAKRHPSIDFDRLGECDMNAIEPLGPGVSTAVAHQCINQLLAAQRRSTSECGSGFQPEPVSAGFQPVSGQGRPAPANPDQGGSHEFALTPCDV